ncbi:BatD family protein [Oharaeibacter diazotrophicus]|uniref:BatD family protein n=1 Tax=Oharaeibacter diazotrophicus TaxID=1920512 RepID=UPI001414D21B|nr:BatD family protein [Oharaeibacter diazotrophicus]
MVSRLLGALVVVLVALAAALAPASAATDPRDGVKLWVEVDHDGPIHPQEMVILRVHGRFTVPVTLEKMTDPTFDGFRALRIDHDRWRDVFEDGLTRRAFERVVAVFPQHSGRLVVPPFVHALTVLDGTMRQVKITVATAPVAIDVVPAPAPAGSWWIAARNLRLTETWTRDPAALGIGESTRRVVTVAADGVFDDQLPPPPTLAVPGLIAFAGPTTRSTRIGLGRPAEMLPLREQALRRKGRLEEVATPFLGPIASADWTFDLRPATSAPVEIPEIRIPWFDTESRTLREAVLPGRVVALAAAAGDAEAARLEAALGIDPGIARPVPAGRRPWLATLTGAAVFAVTLTAALHLVRPGAIGGIGRAIAAALGRRARRLRLRRAARAGDVATVRRLLEVFAAGHDASADRARTALAVLDRHLYAARGERPADLAALAARIG